MVLRRNRRSLSLVLAALCLVVAGSLWVSGERRLDTVRRSMWQQVHESLSDETIRVLQDQAAFALFLAGIVPTAGWGETLTAMLADVLRLHPDLCAIVISGDMGQILLEVWRSEPGASHPAADDLQIVRRFTPLQDQEAAREAILLRTSETFNSPAMVGVGVGFQMPNWQRPGRVTLLSLGADMPSTRTSKGHIWLIGQDDAVIAAPDRATPSAKVSWPQDWMALRHAGATSGVIQVQMDDGPHEVLYRKLAPWPATLVLDTGQSVRPLLEAHGIIALIFGTLAALCLWCAKAMPAGRSDAEPPSPEESVPSADRDAMARRLAGGVAHAINDVLTVLAFDAEMVRATSPDDASLNAISHSMLGAAAQGNQLTRDLLSYAERSVLRPRVVDVQVELLQRHDRLLAALNPGQCLLRAMPSVASGQLLVRVDPDALETCLMALLRNAADVTPPHADIKLELEIVQLPAGEAVAIVVDDAGPGMNAFTLAHAMEPGFSARPDDRRIGLGLSAAQGFARQSGGRLELESTPGLGVRAKLLLPLVDINARGVTTDAASDFVNFASPLGAVSSPRRSGAASLPSYADRLLALPIRVLLVEDNVPVRDSIARRLRADGYNVAVAIAESDVLLLVKGGVDVMITDIVLADAVDGWSLAARAREIDSMLPLVFMSGFMSSRQPELMAGDELATFVRKPINGAELCTVILGLLALRETRQMQGVTTALDPTTPGARS